jgi:hypothetical protein
MAFPCISHMWLLNVVGLQSNFSDHQWDVWIFDNQKKLDTNFLYLKKNLTWVYPTFNLNFS